MPKKTLKNGLTGKSSGDETEEVDDATRELLRKERLKSFDRDSKDSVRLQREKDALAAAAKVGWPEYLVQICLSITYGEFYMLLVSNIFNYLPLYISSADEFWNIYFEILCKLLLPS